MARAVAVGDDHPMSEITREELYDKVWSAPMGKIAKAIGLSDVGLAKLCDRLEVPRPKQGHWARLANGHVVERLPLLPLGSPEWSGRLRRPGTRGGSDVTPKAAPPSHPVFSPPSRREAHPAIVRMMEVMMDPIRERGDATFGVWCRGQATFRASEAQKGRALAFLNHLCKTLEKDAVRAELRPEPNDRHRYALVLFDKRGELRVSIMERVIQRPHEPTAKEIADRKRWGSSWMRKYDQVPSGLLKLELLRLRYSSSIGCWSETPTRRLESELAKVVERVHERLADEQRFREAHEVERQRDRERARQRALEEQRQQHEAALAKDLRAMAFAWSDARVILEFVAQVEPSLAELDAKDGGRRSEWLAWARSHANAIDPTQCPDRIAKRLVPEE